jgi:hypothetical protein
MRSAPDITNVVEACNLDGRQERLENMLSQLELCEKALQVGCVRVSAYLHACVCVRACVRACVCAYACQNAT